ncbi:hypothetical protein [Clostridium paraputrificum]|uniref:hypothetical protein n=1 Tax=Clostridium paraputrificum TaxID=29363 RepID=UPI003F6113F9
MNLTNEDEKVRNIVPNLGSNQEMWLLTEDGLYEVLMLKKIDEEEKLVQTLFVSGQNRKVSLNRAPYSRES